MKVKLGHLNCLMLSALIAFEVFFPLPRKINIRDMHGRHAATVYTDLRNVIHIEIEEEYRDKLRVAANSQ